MKINIDSLITNLAKEATVEFIYLSYSNEFQYVWNNPSLYYDEIRLFLKKIDSNKIDIDLTEISKYNRNFFLHETEFVISYIMMSKLDLPEYLLLSETGLDIFLKGMICYDVFHFVITGYYNDSPILSNLSDNKVRAYLQKIVDNPNISEKLRSEIRDHYLN